MFIIEIQRNDRLSAAHKGRPRAGFSTEAEAEENTVS